MNFEVGKRYKTRSGDIAIVDHVATDGKVWCIVGRCQNRSAIWNKAGRYDKDGYDHLWDLVEELNAQA